MDELSSPGSKNAAIGLTALAMMAEQMSGNPEPHEDPDINFNQIMRNIEALRITLDNLRNFKKVSANCVCAILDIQQKNIFTKIQTDPNADSLLTEVLYIRILQALYPSTIFPEYFSHFLVTVQIKANDNTIVWKPNEVGENRICQVLQLTSMKKINDKIVSLYDKLRWVQNKHDKESLNKLGKVIEKLLITYYNCAKDIDLSHNDLHFNNILFDGDFETLKMIDFGRAYMNMTKLIPTRMKDIDFHQLSEEVKNGYGGKEFGNLLINYHQLFGEYNYLCDIASVTIKILPLIDYSWPDFFQVGLDALKKILVIQVDFNKMVADIDTFRGKNFPIFRLALYWYVICLYSFYNSPINISLTKIYANLIHDRFIYRNGNFIGVTYNMYNQRAVQIFNLLFKNLGNRTTIDIQEGSQTGGGKGCSIFPLGNNIATSQWIHMAGESCQKIEEDDPRVSAWKAEQTKSRIDIVQEVRKFLNLQPEKGPEQDGGNRKRTYKVCMDEHHKKYIRKSKTRVYLTSIKGKYRYKKEDPSYVTLVG